VIGLVEVVVARRLMDQHPEPPTEQPLAASSRSN
jgi:hypothetical protein